ncbi:LysE family transporter [Fusibacter paucivorans]|uniref:LysE family transporter n=1 Tax=Fusibacter paucivorans TaxID=76009 RepID=A0ABS5PJZ7_9FIRM|nr:LysE family transporter [Fusibacter paucivorans]MBS7525475.1 LysE family transporter [Fusibacter paucivorans]
MLLQIAIGPVSIFIFNLAMTKGVWHALSGVSGVVLGDAFFIVLAIIGIGALIDRSPKVKGWMAYLGGIILVLFGLKMSIDAVQLKEAVGLTDHAFAKALFLTVSSPLTIVFWGGVFSSKIVEAHLKRYQLYLFGFGAVLSTALCQSAIAVCGTVFKQFLPPIIQMRLNVVVGVVLIVFGVRSIVKQYRLACDQS